MQFQKWLEPKVYKVGIMLLSLPSQELGPRNSIFFLLCFEIVLCLQYAQTCMNLNWMLKKEWKYGTFVCIRYSKIALECTLNPSLPISIYIILPQFQFDFVQKKKWRWLLWLIYFKIQTKYLFPYISYYFHIPKIFDYLFYSLEKIGIDEKVICYHNISN